MYSRPCGLTCIKGIEDKQIIHTVCTMYTVYVHIARPNWRSSTQVAALWRKLFREKVNETERDDFRRKFERKLKEKKRKEKARFFGGGGEGIPSNCRTYLKTAIQDIFRHFFCASVGTSD
jgi:hypothetical protein